MFCTKRSSSRFYKFHRKAIASETPWRSPWSRFLSLKACSFIKKRLQQLLSCEICKEHLRTAACEFKPVRCIVFIKAMANIASRGEVSFNCHLLFHYSRFNSTIVRNLFPCSTVNNSYRKWEKPLLCYVVKWNLASTLTYFANPPCSWSPSAQLFFVSQERL